MGKSAPSPPAAPDPAATAAAQSTANVDTAKAQAQLNNVNQVTPYGTSTFTSSPSASDPNIPQYTQTVALTPSEQSAVTGQQQLAATLANYGNTLPDQLPTSALSFSGAPALQSSVNTSGVAPLSSPTDFGKQTSDAQTAAYQQAYGLVAPQQQYAQKQLDSQLRNQGIPEGSDAWNQAQNLLSTQQTAQNNNLAQGAVATGNAEQQALSGEALANNQAGFNEASTQAQLGNAARGQSTTEAQTLQNQPFNELAALLQGAPAIGQPNVMQPSQTGIAPTDVIGAYGLQQNANNVAYQGGVNAANSGNSATAGLAGAAITAAALF